MKVGDYCRTDKGKIGKIVHFEPRDKYPYSYDRVILDTEGHKRTTRNIIKCSENIIDLIEVGDFITYEKDNIYINIPTSVNGVFDETTLTIVKMVDNEYLKDVNITSIITHEQIESMKYKVKE